MYQKLKNTNLIKNESVSIVHTKRERDDMDGILKWIIIGCAGALVITVPTLYGIYLIRKNYQDYKQEDQDGS